ncbi:DUF6624 domain-containing protein [Streptomyces sp. 142MFCol3.1]|uniref:DUF6624 domain-containing protein n=1 Tax=Streptomyces sp. 142MFCol3.1 TaxID=1172179 RepID=UPI000400D73E|nr:DUF6624 domain-containing protein [Streptomyces sp. 142MFCol3.1]
MSRSPTRRATGPEELSTPEAVDGEVHPAPPTAGAGPPAFPEFRRHARPAPSPAGGVPPAPTAVCEPWRPLPESASSAIGGEAPASSEAARRETASGLGRQTRSDPPVGAAAVPPGLTTGRPMVPGLAAALAAELLRRVDEERRLMRQARTASGHRRHRALARCREDNAEALATVVHRYGWPSADLVGLPASTAALMILLHAPCPDFQLKCRDLIADAAADGRCPALHHAYIADHCAVELGRPQYYGTRIDPATLRPYPVRRPQTLDERRRDVGLGPLDEQLRRLRAGG